MTPDHVAGPAAGRRQLVRSRHLFAAAAAMSVLLAAGCSNGGGGGTPVSATITVAAVPGVDDAPLWLAQEKGLFTAEGLHVKINIVDSDAAAIAEVENGQAQIAASDYGNIVARQAISNLQTHKGQLHWLTATTPAPAMSRSWFGTAATPSPTRLSSRARPSASRAS
jgi:ABC-type glycerol-3-phosphate transport system substrate-binding protein